MCIRDSSYVIYTDAFNELPTVMKEQIYRRLWEILEGRETSPQFAKLKVEDCRAVKEILLSTKKDLPGYWRGS